jgi:transcriptional regulator with XRE-family HTH domain
MLYVCQRRAVEGEMPRLKFQFTVNWEREEEERYGKYIKAKIKEARERSGLTQTELASKLGRTQAYFSKLESGELVVSIVELLGIAQFTNTPIQNFLPIQDANKEDLTGQEWQLLTLFRKIEDDRIRGIALNQMRQLAEEEKPTTKK